MVPFETWTSFVSCTFKSNALHQITDHIGVELQKKYSIAKTESWQRKQREEKSGVRAGGGISIVFYVFCLNILSWQNAKDFMWCVSQWNESKY